MVSWYLHYVGTNVEKKDKLAYQTAKAQSRRSIY